MSDERSGGCQCGRVRYRVDVTGHEAYFCHCRMCRRATGGAAAAFVSVALDAVTWDGEPDWYRSSPIAERPFCASCGTPFGFRFVERAKNMDLTLGSFDDPGRFVPVRNFAAEGILPQWQDGSHLPNVRSEDNPSVVDRWMAATGRVPE